MSKFRFGDIVRHKESEEVFAVAGWEDEEGFILVLSEWDANLWSVDGSLLEVVRYADNDARRLEWLFENGMSKLDKRVVFGAGVSLDNFRERIDALMFEGG